MSKTGIVAPKAARDPGQVDIPREADSEAIATSGQGTGYWLAVVAIAWFAVTLWVARAGLAVDTDENVALNDAAPRLPGLVQASLIAGAAVGYAIASRFEARLGTALRRHLIGLVAGLLIGALASGAVLLAHGMPARAAGVSALSVGLGGAVGGALGALRPATLARTVIAAAIVTTGLDFLINSFRSQLTGLFGTATTQAEIVSRDGYYLGSKALLIGLVSGIVAFLMLRRTPLRWPAFLGAGAGAGLLIAVAEGITRTVGAQLFSLASAASDFDKTAQAWFSGARLNHALVVLFVGALTAMVMHGRTLGKKDPA